MFLVQLSNLLGFLFAIAQMILSLVYKGKQGRETNQQQQEYTDMNISSILYTRVSDKDVRLSIGNPCIQQLIIGFAMQTLADDQKDISATNSYIVKSIIQCSATEISHNKKLSLLMNAIS